MKKILLVDDDDAFRKLIRLTLVRNGHEVVEARNGNEALAAARDQWFDLIITDLIMPEMEGVETIKAFREKCPGLKIIAMSGGGRVSATDYLKIAKILGADIVLAKPFANTALIQAVEQAFASDET